MPRHPFVLVVVLLLPLPVGHLLIDDLGLARTWTIGARLNTTKPGNIAPDI